MKSSIRSNCDLSRGIVPRAVEVYDACALIAALKSLIEAPSRASCESDEAPPGGFERWEDQDHIYMEAELSGGSTISIDLCVQGGRIYIRAEK